MGYEWVHVTARTMAGVRSLREATAARWLWTRLQRVFPDVAAAVLMPNHVHILARVTDIWAVAGQLGSVLSGFSRHHGMGFEAGSEHLGWEPVPPPRVVPDVLHLRRQVRYVVLNPCRAGLARDPLEWVWSTHRDVVGAAAAPWVPRWHLAAILEERGKGFVARHHAYVSGDPSVAVAGTPPPAAAGEVSGVTLERVAWAAVASVRGELGDLQRKVPARKLFLQLAGRHGWTNRSQLAARCGLTPGAVARALRAPDAPGLEAAEVCLADDRLQRPWSMSGSTPGFRALREA